MAGSVNKVILVGNLGKDPEIRRTQDGRLVAGFNVATSDTWRDKVTGERRERTEWKCWAPVSPSKKVGVESPPRWSMSVVLVRIDSGAAIARRRARGSGCLSPVRTALKSLMKFRFFPSDSRSNPPNSTVAFSAVRR